MKISIKIILEKENRILDKTTAFILDDAVFTPEMVSRLLQQQLFILGPKLIETILKEINKLPSAQQLEPEKISANAENTTNDILKENVVSQETK